jgi:hypothetical protein
VADPKPRERIHFKPDFRIDVPCYPLDPAADERALAIEDIYLRHALRAAQAAQPCFVVLVVPEAGGPRVYARHVWEDELARTLRRVRIAESQGDPSFSRRHFDLRMGERDARDGDLLEWMRATIDAVKPRYEAATAHMEAARLQLPTHMVPAPPPACTRPHDRSGLRGSRRRS